MKNYFLISWKSLLNRYFIVSLTLLCIALSTALLLTLEKIKSTAEGAFTQTVSQVDLLVGPRSGQLQLLLFSVFNMGTPTNNVSWKSYQHWKKHQAVEWTIPYSLGDSYKGFRTVATDESFFHHYRFKGDKYPQFLEGKIFDDHDEVVLGYDVAETLKSKVGDRALITHGVTKGVGFEEHDEHPFKISGILKKTGTILDQSVYLSLEAMEEMHAEGGHHHDEHEHEVEIKNITSFFVKLKNRPDVLKVQREINEFKDEPLMAVIPGAVLAELWNNLSYFEILLKWISWIVAGFSILILLLVMLSSLENRRREMTVFRALGAHLSQISFLLVLEAFVVGLLGVLLGWVISRVGFLLLAPFMSDIVGSDTITWSLSSAEVAYMLCVLVGSVLVSLVPAIKISRQVLKDGLTVKV